MQPALSGWKARLAEQGDPEGAFRWGACLRGGDGVLRDAARGNAWLRAAAEAGHPGARAAQVGKDPAPDSRPTVAG